MRRMSSGGWDLDDLWRAEPVGPRHGRTVPEADPRGAPRAPDARVSRRTLRPGRTPAGIVVALLISAVGWVATAELIWLMLGGRPRWGPLDRLGALGAWTWGDPLVGGIACLLIGCGVALVGHALTPGRPRLIPLRTRDPLFALGLTRAGLRRALAAAVRSVAGVHGVRVLVRADRIEVLVRARARRIGELLPQVAAVVGDALARLGVEHGRQVVLRLRRGRG